ncbi:phytoene desaturase family protein [Jiulongibacter sediminis]|uniref:Pyridine nucleotide-disulfide oxidoreductase domain-containing protein 2 n=1 Tax=Jiulongibacter sediminis TaxID=1605367 RepID=A0A0P7BD92_9BACT|nr:NAD(P)/FAD-dependent oxidoreductase [Jiulongibacter sediminis]KPM48658.1 hypothetical protein AFM12_08635 [Jiulongibacter sediminis]TBX25195.1 hypothetical protein TK44_08640 [Jiulongibacter sediminis]
MNNSFDIIITGSGHNALVAACYLAKAGKTVLVLEKNDYLGGATTSQKTFPEFEAYLSRYSYLISLLPQQIIEDLQLDLPLLQRKTASYTPYENEGKIEGLLLSNINSKLSKASVLSLRLGEKEWEGYQKFQERCQTFASLIWDSILQPLASKSYWKQKFENAGESELWEDIVEKPIGMFIEKYVQSDILRGVLLTDARIGVLSHAYDPSLLQNRTFIYHIIGNKTGEWRVPKGGMGNLVKQLIQKATELGVDFKTSTEVKKLQEITEGMEVRTEKEVFRASKVLWNAAPAILEKTLANYHSIHTQKDEGTAFKINILLEKLPQLKDKNVKPEEAFSGTFHINQSFRQQQKAFEEIMNGYLPKYFPCEMYCHTLTDNSILSDELNEKGFHTITVFGLDMPYRRFTENNEAQKEKILYSFYDGINQFLEEPIQNCIARNSDGSLCIECKSALDLEKDLGLPMGNIFHNDLSWFFAESEEEADQFGVETDLENLILCGSGAKRGGAVSGIPGYLAARMVLEKEKPD